MNCHFFMKTSLPLLFPPSSTALKQDVVFTCTLIMQQNPFYTSHFLSSHGHLNALDLCPQILACSSFSNLLSLLKTAYRFFIQSGTIPWRLSKSLKTLLVPAEPLTNSGMGFLKYFAWPVGFGGHYGTYNRKYLSLTPSCPSPHSPMSFPRALSPSHRAELSAAPSLWGAAAAMRPPLSSSALRWANQRTSAKANWFIFINSY